MSPPPPHRAEEGQRKKKRKSLASLPGPGATGQDRGPGNDQDGRHYTPVLDSCADSFADVAAGKSDLWLIQLPEDVDLNKLNGASLKVDTRARLARTAGIIGSVTDATGNQFALSEENAGVAEQMHVLVPAGEGQVLRYKPAKRLTLAVNTIGMDGRPLFGLARPAAWDAEDMLLSPERPSSKQQRKVQLDAKGANPGPGSGPLSGSKLKLKKQRHKHTDAAGTSGRDHVTEDAAGSAMPQQDSPEQQQGASAERKKKKKKPRVDEQPGEHPKMNDRGSVKGPEKKKPKKHKAADG